MTKTPATEEILQRCPFCNSDAYAEIDQQNNGKGYVEIGCEKCGVHFHAIGTFAEVSQRWNARPAKALDASETVDLEAIPPSVLDKVVEALEEGKDLFDDDMTDGHYKLFQDALKLLQPYLEE
jgi:hypothetical protein